MEEGLQDEVEMNQGEHGYDEGEGGEEVEDFEGEGVGGGGVDEENGFPRKKKLLNLSFPIKETPKQLSNTLF